MEATFEYDPPRVAISQPEAGSFVNGSVTLNAQITDSEPIAKITVFWDNADVKDLTGSLGTNYSLAWTFTPGTLNSQNLLRVEAYGASGASSGANAIVYH